MNKGFLGLVGAGMLACASVFAGGMDSGGGDIHAADYGAAWFLGEREIKVCLEAADDFGHSRAELAGKVGAAFSKWTSYIRDRKVQDLDPVELRMSLSHRILETCDGSQDLKFFFGATDEQVELAKKRFSQPVALAYRSSYDVRTGWGSGFIWVAKNDAISPGLPNWSLPARLDGMILHELGHVFGCDHVEGTIMDEDLARKLQWGDIPNTDLPMEQIFSRIDSHRILHGGKITLEIPGSVAPPKADPSDVISAFERFVGRKPHGEARAAVRIDRRRGSLILSDALGSKELVFHDDSQGARVDITQLEMRTRVFKRARILDDVDLGSPTTRHSGSKGSVIYPILKGADGNAYQLTVETNMNSGPVRIKYFANGRRMELFYSVAEPRVVN